MKKTLLILAALFASLIMFYGAVSAMVNKGYPLWSAIIIFFVVVGGAFILVKSMKPDQDSKPPE